MPAQIARESLEIGGDLLHPGKPGVLGELEGYVGQRLEALAQNLPGGVAVGQDEEGGTHDLEGRARRLARVLWTDRERGHHRTEVSHHPVHQVLGRLSQSLEFIRRLAIMDEVAALDLERD